MLRKLILTVALTVTASQAFAVPCANTTHVEKQLLAKHGEAKSFFGTLPNENLLQVFLNDDSESWSIVVQVPARGLSCLLSTGYGYETVIENSLLERVDLLPMS